MSGAFRTAELDALNRFDFKKLLMAMATPLLLGLASPSFAGMVWTARAIDPSLISAIRSDNQLLRETLFGEPPRHGIHYLLTGSAEPNGTLASKVIMGGEDIGQDQGYGAAQLLKPDEVKAIAQLLERTTPEMLRARYKPDEMTRADVHPSVIWARDRGEALEYVLDNYKKVAAFYRRAAERGKAVIFALS